MSNSSLVNYTKLTNNCTKPRNRKIDAIVIHHMAGNLTVETCGNVFSGSRQASSNYGVGTDGRIGMYVEEKNRAWTTSNSGIDNRAVTIEVANSSTGGNWPVSDKALKSLIKLCADICKRNGIKKLNYTGDKSGNLHMHKWYAATNCPGPYLGSKFPYIASEVNKILNGSTGSNSGSGEKSELYRVRKTWADSKSQKGAFTDLKNAKKCADENPGYEVYDESGKIVYSGKGESSFLVRVSVSNLRIRKGPGTNYSQNYNAGKKGYTGVGNFTIVETKSGEGSKAGWGLLKTYSKDRNGWIALDHAKRI